MSFLEHNVHLESPGVACKIGVVLSGGAKLIALVDVAVEL
jgi:hypothetical protein